MANVYAAGLAGYAHDDVVNAAKAFVKLDNLRIFNFVRSLCAYFEDSELSVVVITGAPAEPMEQYADLIGFELAGSLQLEVTGGLYSGRIVNNFGLHDQKLSAVRDVSKDRTIVMAFGDSESDLPMLDAASIGFVVRNDVPSTRLSGPYFVQIDPTLSSEAISRLVKDTAAEIVDA